MQEGSFIAIYLYCEEKLSTLFTIVETRLQILRDEMLFDAQKSKKSQPYG